MINKLKGVERKENEVPLYDEEYEIIEKNKISEEMLGYRETIYRKNDKMKKECNQNKGEEYRDEWQEMGVADGSMTIEYNNRQVYERIPDPLMINRKLEEGRMWRGRDGRFVVQYNRGREKQIFSYRMEEHMDMFFQRVENRVWRQILGVHRVHSSGGAAGGGILK